MDGWIPQSSRHNSDTVFQKRETVKKGDIIQSRIGGLEKKEKGVAHSQPVSRSCHIVSVSARS